ncbi:MAG TPA: glycoside hydrolase family 101 beta sandwich domain-containing protein [Pirellulales bacterium]|nr:glycoside hydrolase family 101 beta sandwich domain-containing protein [Pirellulales bacterium]
MLSPVPRSPAALLPKAFVQKAIALLTVALTFALGDLWTARAPAADEVAKAAPPVWAEQGSFVYRVSTPDAADTLDGAAAGLEIVANLLDHSVPQIPIFNGLVGHDHPGQANWDGLWPDWNRVTFRAGHDWGQLAAFMTRIRDRSNARASFHVNLTDVDTGLADYPETREFFQQLVRTGSIYRRDYDRQARKRQGEPYVPDDVDEAARRDGFKDHNPIRIIALVNYKKFWDSGMARGMIDEFYSHLPYPPALLYLDVLTLTGGNFATGPPDGSLGGSEQSQREGVISIVDYLHSKGTDLGTEGDRPYGNRPDGTPRAGYVWYHGRGFSADDYRVISGGSHVNLPGHHVFGDPGAFNVSPIALTSAGLEAVRAHYAALLAGQPSKKKMPGLDTWHISYRAGMPHDEFDIPGTGDAFRGDWADLVDSFYLAAIQENYHIGRRNVRRMRDGVGTLHFNTYRLTDAGDNQITVSLPDFLTDWRKAGAQKAGDVMLAEPLETRVTVPHAGRFKMSVQVRDPVYREWHNFNVYVAGRLHQNIGSLPRTKSSEDWLDVDAGEIELVAGENTIAFDAGILAAEWSDGTTARWPTPYLRRGFTVTNGDVTYAADYDRMWPDTWSGQKKIYFFSWDGTERAWKLPPDWRELKTVTLYPLSPTGRGTGVALTVADGSVTPKLLPHVPYVAVP